MCLDFQNKKKNGQIVLLYSFDGFHYNQWNMLFFLHNECKPILKQSKYHSGDILFLSISKYLYFLRHLYLIFYLLFNILNFIIKGR